ncbi:MAG TPA: hypothetical protein DDX54_06065 [Rhodospirillaceae bacterium]|jgi:Raf kinase inhibitor-like YbhB/YbcL family protein|nr:YbhB/YbcL family Raf kinase inhibitor-like protein [Alphaproteobacteria bacterium]HBH26950.1 hypothetical protein [Rhodospirillaceae bacterium]
MSTPSPRIPPCAPEKLTITSGAVREGEPLHKAQAFTGAGGGNISPDLAWTSGPAGTAAYAVTCFDPDAPTGAGWWHWVLVNIPPSVTALAAGEVPSGALVARNDYGTPGYGGACPPEGDGPHRYAFTVYALREAVPEGAVATPTMAAFHLHALKIAEGTVTGTYER